MPLPRFPLTLALLALAAAPAHAQDAPPAPATEAPSPLPRLLAERKRLTDAYAAASAQRHSLFGNKPSKDDLREVVDALQGIVNQDEKIVALLNRQAAGAQALAQQAQLEATKLAATTTHLETSSRDDRNLTAQRLAELQNDLQNAQQRLRQNTERQRTLEADAAEAQQGRWVRDALIALLGVACAGLLLTRRKGAAGKR